jgi:uncharacterized protein
MTAHTIDMQSSPLDRDVGVAQPPSPTLLQLAYTPPERWIPSRYNARTVADDGRLILWNTYTGAVSVFAARHQESVLAALSVSGISGPLGKMGTYLKDRGFLVRASRDELMQFRYLFAQQHWRTDILQLILLASEDCNFRCVYCYEKFKTGTMQPEVRQGVINLLEQRAPTLRELSVGWFGGEPLYGWDAVQEISPYAKKLADKYGIKHYQNMTTNGYLLTEERATKLLDWGCRHFQITVDGLAEEHDCKRVGRDGSPTHAVIMENLRSLAKRDTRYTVLLRVNFDQHNFPKLAPFIESLSEDFSGDSRFKLSFHAVGRWGGDNDDNLAVCGTGEQRSVVEDVRAHADANDLLVDAGIADRLRPGSHVCYAARPFNFLVGATGKLMKCTIALDDDPANVVGRILPDGTLEVNDENMAKWVTPHFETDSMCQSCYVLPGCQGAACPLTRVRSGQRTCCDTKSALKREMKFTLRQSDRARGVSRGPSAERELAAI